MNRLILTILLLLAGTHAFSQNIEIDIRKNWYCQVLRLEMDQLDTLVLSLTEPAADPARPMLLWQYAGDNVYQVLVLHNPTPGLEPIYPTEHWKLVQTGRADYDIKVSDADPKKLLHGRIRRYKLIQVRNYLLVLQQIILVRQKQ
ncbi:MAG: hypothetical protein H0X33_07275 [Taibaiella sp.]|nr:hypothetical protein [Taibaiella sp.]